MLEGELGKMTDGPLEQELLGFVNELKLNLANEAETRLKLIDRVIFEILGWDRKDVTVESRVVEDGKAGITDYKFVTATTSFIIEAKRITIQFKGVVGEANIPLTEKNLTGEFGDTVRQARDYCRSAGIPFAAITNGDAWFIFPAVRTDGIAFNDSTGIYFSSLESILLFNRDSFYELLSRDAVIARSLDHAFLGTIENQIEQRRLNEFFGSSTPKLERANIFELVENEFVLALNPQISGENKELLRSAYVQTPSRVRFDQRIQMQVRRAESVTQKAPLRPMKGNEAESFVTMIRNAASRARQTAILLLGPVGSGKTTFLDYTYLVSGEQYFQKRRDKPYPHWIKVDFLSFSESQNPRSYLMTALLRFIQEEPFLSDYERCGKHAFAKEIDGLFRGPLRLFRDDEQELKRHIGDFLMDQFRKCEPYVTTILRYASSNAPVFLVIDNVDQIEDQAIQDSIFKEAMAVAQEARINLILSMRDATYVRSRNSPSFNAFDFDPVVIDPPRVDAVLSKRFAIAESLVEGKAADFYADNGVKMHVSDLRMVVDMLRRSVLGTEIGHQIDVLATGDIRLALRMTREFLQYGYSATAKAFRIFSTEGRYNLPPHEALRAIMLGNQTVYREEFSSVGNPFDAHLNRTEVQLARLFILNAIVSYASNAQFQFVSSDDIVGNCAKIGLSNNAILKVLQDLVRFRFVQTSAHGPATLEANYLPTRLGGYIVRHYLANFTFIENVMMDTFIPFDESWEELRELSASVLREKGRTLNRLQLRKKRVTIFFSAMKRLYEPLVLESRKRALCAEWCADPMLSAEQELTRNLERATRSAERNYGDEAKGKMFS